MSKILPIITSPNKILNTKAEMVTNINSEIKNILDDMLETMYHANGIGLAANQVAILKRLIVIHIQAGNRYEKNTQSQKNMSQPIKIINPEIVQASTEKIMFQEGCLSFPGIRIDVQRAKEITVKYTDPDEKIQTIKCDGLLAVCMQHEIDHLNGITFETHLSKLKRDNVRKKMLKYQKQKINNES